MSAPLISALALKKVEIDPYIEYTYVLPVLYETSRGFTPRAEFNASMTGRVLTYQYYDKMLLPTVANDGVGNPIFSDTDVIGEYPMTLFASNDEDTFEHVVTFKVRTAKTSGVPTFYNANSTNGSPNIDFGSTIGALLRVNDAVIFSGATAPLRISDGVRYVKSISGSTFQVSGTVGGSALNAGATELAGFKIAIQRNGSDQVFVGPTAGMALDDPIFIGATNNAIDEITTQSPYPTPTAAPLFVAGVIDGYHVYVSATQGGSTITAAANVFATSVGARTSIVIATYARAFVNITDPTFLKYKPKGGFDETLASSPGVDLWQVKGLPVELRLPVGDTDIVGVAPASGYYPITVIGRKGLNDSLRTLVLEIDET